MGSNFDFLPQDISKEKSLLSIWNQAIRHVSRALEKDRQLGTSKEKMALKKISATTIDALSTIADALDNELIADRIELSEFSKKYRFSEKNISTLRRFVAALRHEVATSFGDDLNAIPAKRRKQALPTAAYFAGRICSKFNLGRPTNYANDDHETASIAVNLIRELLIQSGKKTGINPKTIKPHIHVAQKAYDEIEQKIGPGKMSAGS